MNKTLLTLGIAASSLFLVSCDGDDAVAATANTQQRTVRITFQANGPLGFAPMLFTAHSGNVDFFDTGSAASAAVELMAELGDISQVRGILSSAENSAATGTPTAPNASATVTMTIDQANRYFSYIGMALPSSDTFIGNNNPTQFDLSPLFAANPSPIVIQVNRLYDAGTEVNDFLTSPGGGLVGAPVGVPTNGVPENGVITLNAANHFSATYANAGAFNAASIDPNGANVATITITVVP